MERGKWFLEYTVHIWGEDSEGSGRDITDTLSVLISAEDEGNAELAARSLMKKFAEAMNNRDWKFFEPYCGQLAAGENIEFSDFKLLMEKPLILNGGKTD